VPITETRQTDLQQKIELTSHSTQTINALPLIWSSDLEVTEGDDMNPIVALKVSLSKKAHGPVGVSYKTIAASASSPSHYEAVRGRLVFRPGETYKHLEIQVFSDKIANGDRHFHVQFSSASNARIANDGKYRIDIHDDLSDAPAVTGVAVSSTPDPSALVQIDAGDGASQLKNIGIANVEFVHISFSTDVIVAKEDLSILNSVKGKAYQTTDRFFYDSNSHVATWQITPAITADRLNLVLNSNQIQARISGVGLDGTWVNPEDYDDLQNGSNFPSGGAGPGHNFEFKVNILTCDFDQNDKVDNADIDYLIKQQKNSSYESYLDINQDTVLDESDLKACEGYLGNTLAASL
jgi:hypothetical protein